MCIEDDKYTYNLHSVNNVGFIIKSIFAEIQHDVYGICCHMLNGNDQQTNYGKKWWIFFCLKHLKQTSKIQ